MLILLIGLPNSGKKSIIEKAQGHSVFTTDLNIDPSSVDRVWGVIDSTLNFNQMNAEFNRIDKIIQKKFPQVPKKGLAMSKCDLKLGMSLGKYYKLSHLYKNYRRLSVSSKTYYNLNYIDSYDYLVRIPVENI